MRKSGILMPVASLPGPYGIGSLGKPAFAFIDFLKRRGRKCGKCSPFHLRALGTAPIKAVRPSPATPILSISISCAKKVF